ncbi:hypothetical protein PCANC_12481 [Puccinia coronata f. sp. avenae]|uniref:OTU domain-containing protein n=1 Tax=Puccinia coronata f. sp. avenae TaxID=200324 RepID=A0A2N5ULI9_9BASI|nr:hypothetical protein PCANC_12481 [Puccinia coronata f. sp. avenae]
MAQIAEILENRDSLAPEDFHAQWSLKYNPETTTINEPELDLEEELKKLGVALTQEEPQALEKIICQLHQIVAGTHYAVLIQDPKVKRKTKGRPALKKAQTTSTKRNASAFEIVEEKIKKVQLAKKRALNAPSKQKSKRVKKNDESKNDIGEHSDYEGSTDESSQKEEEESDRDAPDEERITVIRECNQDAVISKSDPEGGPYYAPQIPSFLRQFIKTVFDPCPDSNCGFRCMARALGYDKDGWLQVESLKSKITIENWLNKLYHGHMLANVYQRPIIFLSDKGSTSFFPLQIGPNSENSEPIYLLFIDGTHWVLAHVEGIDGVKPIPPPFLAPKHTSRSAKQWVDHLKKGLDLYQAKAAAKKTA